MVNAFLNFAKDRRGNVIVMFALLLPILLLVIGGSIEFGKNGNVQAKMQDIANSASLAGMSPKDITDEERTQLAKNYINASYINGEFNENFDNNNDVTITSSDAIVTVEIKGKTAPMFAFLGRDDIPVAIKSTAIPNVKEIPAAVDVVVGMDGGCGNEDWHRKLESQSNSVQNLMQSLRSRQNGRDLIYASAIWSGADMGGNNSSWDSPNLTNNLEGIFSRIHRPFQNAHGGTSMPNVLQEMFSSKNGYFNDGREQSLQDKKYRIGIIFQGAHHEYQGLDDTTTNYCSGWAQSQFDGFYVFLIDGPQNKNNPCSRNKATTFPDGGPYATIQTCQKPMAGINYPAMTRGGTSDIQNRMDTLAAEITNLKVTVRAGARITE